MKITDVLYQLYGVNASCFYVSEGDDGVTDFVLFGVVSVSRVVSCVCSRFL